MIDGATLTILCTTLGASVTTLALGLLQYFREGRQHRWIVEQAERDRADRGRVELDLKARVQTVSTKLDANTEISKAAFTEANNVNLKLIALGRADIEKP